MSSKSATESVNGRQTIRDRGKTRQSKLSDEIICTIEKKELCVGFGYEITEGVSQKLYDRDNYLPVEQETISVPFARLQENVGVFGTTGSGKTRLLEFLAAQIIRAGAPLIYIDPKGDMKLRQMIRRSCELAKRGSHFFSLAPGTPSEKYNPLKNFIEAREIGDRVSALISDKGEGIAFRNFAWHVVSNVVGGLVLAKIPVTLKNIKKYSLGHIDELICVAIEKTYPGAQRQAKLEQQARSTTMTRTGFVFDNFKTVIEIYKDLVYRKMIAANSAIDEMIVLYDHPKEHFQKMISSLKPVLSKLSTGSLEQLLSPEPREKDVIDFSQIVDRRAALYMDLAALTGIDTARCVMKMIAADLISFCGTLYAKGRQLDPPLFVIVDELSEAISDDFVNFLSKSRGAGISFIVASQSTSDIVKAIGEPGAMSLINNLNTIVQLKTHDITDVELIQKIFGRARIEELSVQRTYEPALFKSGKGDVDDFRANERVSRRTLEKPVVPEECFTSLKKFHGFARCGDSVFAIQYPVVKVGEEK